MAPQELHLFVFLWAILQLFFVFVFFDYPSWQIQGGIHSGLRFSFLISCSTLKSVHSFPPCDRQANTNTECGCVQACLPVRVSGDNNFQIQSIRPCRCTKEKKRLLSSTALRRRGLGVVLQTVQKLKWKSITAG